MTPIVSPPDQLPVPTRDAGRHPVYSRYSREEYRWRLIAADLDQRNVNWMIFWGCYSKLFLAFPIINIGYSSYIGELDPAELERRIKAVEITALAYRAHAPVPRRSIAIGQG